MEFDRSFSPKATFCFLVNTVTNTAQRMKFSIKDFFSNCYQIHSFGDLVTFTEEILNGKHHFLCSVTLTKRESKFNHHK